MHHRLHPLVIIYWGPVLEIPVILMFSFKCAEVYGADRCGGRRVVQLGFSISLPILLLALVLAHDIVVFFGYHFGRPSLIN